MKKIIGGLCLLIVSTTAFSATKTLIVKIKVTCEVTHTKTDKNGSSELTRVGVIPVSESVSITNKNSFYLETLLTPVCELNSSNTCSDNYELQVKIKNKLSLSSIDSVVSSKDGGRRVSTSLSVDSENLSVNCDVE